MKRPFSLKVICLAYIRKLLPSERVSWSTDEEDLQLLIMDGGNYPIWQFVYNFNGFFRTNKGKIVEYYRSGEL